MLSASADTRQCLAGSGEDGAHVAAAASTSVNMTPCSYTLGCSELAFGGVFLSTDCIREFRFQTKGDSVNTFPPSLPAW